MKLCKCGRRIQMSGEDWQRIRDFAAAHPCVDQTEIAKLLGISHSRVSEIVRNRPRKTLQAVLPLGMALFLAGGPLFAQTTIPRTQNGGQLLPLPSAGSQPYVQVEQKVTVVVVNQAPAQPDPVLRAALSSPYRFQQKPSGGE